LLRWRLLLAVVFVAALAGLMRLDFLGAPGVFLMPLALVAGLGGAHEVVTLLARSGYAPLAGIIYGGSFLVIASNAIPMFVLRTPDDQPTDRLGWPLIALALVLLTTFVAEMGRYRRPGGTVVNVALAVFGVAYVGVLLSFTLQLRMLGGPVTGMLNLIALIAVVKMSDVGAYAVGRLIGRHKMAPVLSPGKTVEGAAAALVFACATAWFVYTYLPLWLGCNRPQHPFGWMFYGLTVGAAGMLGDLAESLLKRDLGAKDSSTWLPGFGGVLDLLDSILYAAPVAYLCALLQMT
jgi:phosphatidate cytidylyltransferase